MSILQELKTELKRIMIAGGELAAGDARLTKLAETFKGGADKSPVFARFAENLGKITAPKEENRIPLILDTAVLADAVLYTQSESNVKGEASPLPQGGEKRVYKRVSYKRARELIEALTTKGAERDTVIAQAAQAGYLEDARFTPYLANALADTSESVARLAMNALFKLGRGAMKYAEKDLDLSKGVVTNVRRLTVISEALTGEEHRAYFLNVYQTACAKLKAAALEELGRYSDDAIVDILLAALNGKSAGLKQSALIGLGRASESEKAYAALHSVYLEAAKKMDGATANYKKMDEYAEVIKALEEAGTPKALKLLEEECEKAIAAKTPNAKVLSISQGSQYLPYELKLKILELCTAFFEGGFFEKKKTELAGIPSHRYIGSVVYALYKDRDRRIYKDILPYIPRFERLFNGGETPHHWIGHIFTEAFNLLPHEEFLRDYLPFLKNKKLAQSQALKTFTYYAREDAGDSEETLEFKRAVLKALGISN